MKIFNSEFKKLLKRKSDSNKGDFGHALIIGGDYGMGGAVIMAAEAAYRSGAGRVTVLTREENITALLARLPNVMTVSFNSSSLEKVIDGKNIIIIGCGLGKSKWAEDLLALALASKSPKVIDADALNVISASKKNFDLSDSIITPHPGEAARLLAIGADEVQKNRLSSIKKLYEKFGATTVLKGKNTLVLGNTKKMHTCHYGNPGMAVAGMGDVLSGIIGGLRAQHLNNEQAAIYGVNIHAFAGDLAARKQGEIGMIPTDLFEYLPKIINNKISTNNNSVNL